MRIGLIAFFVTFLTGCNQKTDFEACVDYYTKRAAKLQGTHLTSSDREKAAEYMIDSNCRLSGKR